MAKAMVAVCGVSGTGKTTLLNALSSVHQTINVLEEATFSDIATFSDVPLEKHKWTVNHRKNFDRDRVVFQFQRENNYLLCDHTDQYIFIEKAVPVSLMYLLTIHARDMAKNEAKWFVQEMNAHVQNYTHIVYMPYCYSWQGHDTSLERNITDTYVLGLQDAALQRVLDWVRNANPSIRQITSSARLPDTIEEVNKYIFG